MMNDPVYLQKEHQTAHEPKLQKFIKQSFIFVPTVGMRHAPEILVLELMREIFCDKFSDTQAARDFEPEKKDSDGNFSLSNEERAVLYAFLGRRKETKSSNTQRFFAPAYPHLAQLAWLRKSEARVINNLLFGGPIAQHLWFRGDNVEEKLIEQDKIAELIHNALLGQKSWISGDSPNKKEILSVALGKEAFSSQFTASERQKERMKTKMRPSGSIMKISTQDELASRITVDIREICNLESRIPRMQWLQLLMTFLRFALPMWLLSQMRMTNLLHEWLLKAVDNELVEEPQVILTKIANRNRELLQPTLTATHELHECIESYIKHRIELSVLLYCVENFQPNLNDKKLILDESGGVGRNSLTIHQLLVNAKKSANQIKSTERFETVSNGRDISIAAFLTREGEQFSGWRKPLMCGQGKNIDEFFRVLYKAEIGDEAGGYLLHRDNRRSRKKFRVFPGQLLLKTITFLAARNKRTNGGSGGAGKLVLQDVEDHFAYYGIEFGKSADARPLLIQELQAMGLLSGSPDAGSSVSVDDPY